MASFQAKIGWKWMTMRKNKIYRSAPSYPTGNRKFQKNSKKIETYHYDIISSQNRLENAEKERIEKLSLRFIPIRRVI